MTSLFHQTHESIQHSDRIYTCMCVNTSYARITERPEHTRAYKRKKNMKRNKYEDKVEPKEREKREKE